MGLPPDDFRVLAESASTGLDDHKQKYPLLHRNSSRYKASTPIRRRSASSLGFVLQRFLFVVFTSAARKLNAMCARQLDGSVVRTYELFKAGSETKHFTVVGSEQTIPNSSKIAYFLRAAMTTFLQSRGTRRKTRSDYRANLEAREIRRVRLVLLFQMKGRACGFVVDPYRQKPKSELHSHSS